ncbi:MAG: cation-translocating P-type ATPase [Desulfuromonas sp.]|nr:MAG: cation-translocating P-type ATPase [Desulfuromonas sp.]
MKEFYQQSIETVFAELHSSDKGLIQVEVEERLARYGPNTLETSVPINPLLIFIDQFKSFIIYILLFAVAFSLLIGEWVDSVIILAILLMNAIIGFFQELSAHKSLEALKQFNPTWATALRDGKPKSLEAKHLVPGDVVLLEAGDKIPADVRLLETVRLKIDESILTGESVPVEKQPGTIEGKVSLGDRLNMLFAGTSVATGHARGVVVATGMQTELGCITELIKSTGEEMTPLQRRLDRFGKQLGYAIISICLIIFTLCLAKAHMAGNLSMHILVDLAFIAISLAVAAVPTALPAVVTIALSIGTKRLLGKKALVRNLSSVETLGSCDVICTDKTGTLTANQMTVRFAWSLDGETALTGVGYAPEGEVTGPLVEPLFDCGILCNNAALHAEDGSWRISGDPTEAALLTSAAKAGVNTTGRRLDEIPFDSERKLMSVRIAIDNQEWVYSKGALDSLLHHCDKVLDNGTDIPLDNQLAKRIKNRHDAYADQAMRVLAFARKQVRGDDDFTEDGLTFLGLQAMVDPPRPDVVDSIRRTRQAGIRVIMITGDYGATATAIGREIGIEGKLLDGEAVSGMEPESLQQALRDGTNIFSRVAPEHKQRIIDALQRMNYTVAMTGDGVNDAPALKKANIGVAVGSGTDVAKEAADFVLLDNSFTHIVNAIEEGRGIYDNIQKSIMLLLSGNLGEVLIIFLAVIIGLNLPLTAILLLWINMVTDGAPALAYSVDPYGRDIMRRQPKPHAEGILPGPKLALLCVLGCVGTAIALILFYWYGGSSSDEAVLIRAQTMVFNFVVLYEVILTFVIRKGYQVPLLANKWVWGATGLAVGLQGLLMYTSLAKVFRIVPLGWTDLGVLAGAGMLFAIASLLYQRFADRGVTLPRTEQA